MKPLNDNYKQTYESRAAAPIGAMCWPDPNTSKFWQFILSVSIYTKTQTDYVAQQAASPENALAQQSQGIAATVCIVCER
jgi:hypothetical protein